ncbi:MAG: response regulator [Gammaproteobacteria bacterium]|nr:response regulator [Gammaproteobacteria bacterium]
MTTPVLICDDSSFARKQMARALPEKWDIKVSLAGGGEECLEMLAQGKGELLFLDLNMPGLDGYGVLQAIRERDLPTMVIVVSGDVQPEAHQRVKALGAMEFIKKPVSIEHVQDVLNQYGLYLESDVIHQRISVEVDIWDGYREVTNVAMGRAADLLARVLGNFVKMPIPHINMIDMVDLQMVVKEVEGNDTISAVCQGFIGSGIAGEALLIFKEQSFDDMASLMKMEGEIGEAKQLELLMDLSNILIGAFLKAISEQLEFDFSMGHPNVLGRHLSMHELMGEAAKKWNSSLAIEMGYVIENKNISCDLLILFTEDSIPALENRVSSMIG